MVSTDMVIGYDNTRLVPGNGEDMLPIPQVDDSVRFTLGTRPITLDMVRDPETGVATIFVDNAMIGQYPMDIADAHYRTALETARRIGKREF